MQLGGSTDLATQLLEKRPQITVDKDGGMFLLSTCPYAISKTLTVKYKAMREIKQGDG